jgi:regulator of protease activity HflC (stomatin/prohibitin superfamily)
MSGLLIFLIVLAVIVLATILRGVRTVPQGSQWTVERFGRYRVTLGPGLHLVNPFIDSIGRKVNVQETWATPSGRPRARTCRRGRRSSSARSGASG